MNKSLILIVLMFLTPAISVMGLNSINTTTVEPNDFDTAVGVVAGDTLYYNIDAFVLPDGVVPPEITIPDMTDNTLYVKVLYVQDDYDFDGTEGIAMWYSLGLIFEKDSTLTVIESSVPTSFIIPEGAATPSMPMLGQPHFNDSDLAPSFFFINNDWADHETKLSAIGFSVTNGATELEATVTAGDGSISGTWRKSDGVLTHLLFDDIVFMDMNLTDATIEISLNELVHNPLPVTTGEQITFMADTINLEISGDGPIWEEIPDGIIENITSTASSYEGKTMLKLTIDEVKGLFYKCSLYAYNFETDLLEKDDYSYVFCGFFGAVTSYYDQPFYDSISPPGFDINMIMTEYVPGVAPWITPDWDIYAGILKLADTAIGVYVQEILDFVSIPTSEVTLHTVGGEVELINKGDFYYFYVRATIDEEVNETESTGITILGEYDEGTRVSVEAEAYLCYHETGIMAAVKAAADVTYTYYNETHASNIHGVVTLKLRNPVYSPPEIIRDGILPGFDWLIAIPALAGVAAFGLIKRRRK